MNIEQYRAMKLAEENKPKEEVNPVVEQPKEEQKEEPKPKEEVKDYIEINGEQIKIEELKNGYLRQSDYTKKTQKLANDKKEIDEALSFYEKLKKDPNAIEVIKQNIDIPSSLDPTQKQIQELEDKFYDMVIEKEINELQAKYDDFEIMDVMKIASEKNLTSLEDAYFIYKASNQSSKVGGSKAELDINTLKEQLKQEILNEMNELNTNSIITSKGGGNIDSKKDIIITSSEAKVASAMGMGIDEYAKWRDANKK